MSTLPKNARKEIKNVSKKQKTAVKTQQAAVKAAVKPRKKMSSAPKTPSKDHQTLVGMRHIADSMKKNELALVSNALTARLPMQVPDGNGRRTMPLVVKASFPLQGNSYDDTQYPSLINSDGTVSLVVKPSLRGVLS